MWHWLSTVWSWLSTVLDVSIPDLISIICIVTFPLHRIWTNRWQPLASRVELLMADLLRGAAFSTFVIIIIMAASKQFMLLAYDHNRVILFLAGFIGAISVIKADKWLVDFFRDEKSER
jgi:hypothetical protein